MSAKSRILDAYEQILRAEGERAATLEAIALRAEVSKGGLLYHFRDKKALVSGLLERLEERAQEDVEQMRADPEGPCVHYIRSSVYEALPLDRTMAAVTQLSQESHPEVLRVMKEIHQRWYELLLEEAGDVGIARAVLLIGDGLYYDAALAAPVQTSPGDLERVIEVVRRLVAGAGSPPPPAEK